MDFNRSNAPPSSPPAREHSGPVHIAHLRARKFERSGGDRAQPHGDPEARCVRLQRHDGGVTVIGGWLRLGGRQLIEPGHAGHRTLVEPPDDFPPGGQALNDQGTMVLPILGSSLQQQHKAGVLPQIVQIDRRAILAQEFPCDAHAGPRGRRCLGRHR